MCNVELIANWRGNRLQTALVKKPEDREILDLVDVECVYPEARSSECTAPPGYRCPYRHYRRSIPTAHTEMLSQSESGLSHSPPLRLTLKRS
jgi:hypothetical protein